MILVTGAAGSIGSELCRQLSKKNRVVALDQDESGLFDLTHGTEIIPELANIRNFQKMTQIFEKYQPSMVYHAAAYKHLSDYEREHFSEIVETNIIGIENLVILSNKHGIKLIFISTDKAVNPTSLMGATKLVGEIIVKRNCHIVVRFGNVIGSRGSVVPIWENQVASGEPLTITDREMKRYFMTIEDACELVIKAGQIGKSGETIILDMGEQKLITDLAEEVFPGYPTVFIGAKQGEKLKEELMTEEEKLRAIKRGKFWIIK